MKQRKWQCSNCKTLHSLYTSPQGVIELFPLNPVVESWRERNRWAQAEAVLEMAQRMGIADGSDDTLTFDELANKGDLIEDPWVHKILEDLS